MPESTSTSSDLLPSSSYVTPNFFFFKCGQIIYQIKALDERNTMVKKSMKLNIALLSYGLPNKLISSTRSAVHLDVLCISCRFLKQELSKSI